MTASHVVLPHPGPALIVERYAVYEGFAAGGMATVHFARLLGAQGFRRTVAAKRLMPHLQHDHDFALMLIDEARLAARVRHPNVVSTLDVVQTERELLLVMDYVHGESLATLVRAARERGERVPMAVGVAIVSSALHGLHAAHEATNELGAPLGLVHRDVSPQNVLVGLDGIPRIADFGVAKAAGRVHTTRDGAFKGKLSYVAPEQFSAGEVTRAADVFAAAVVLWELLTGERLFAGGSHAETVLKVMASSVPLPNVHDASLPSALQEIVMRGLERDPARRFASALEMALALEAVSPSVRASEIGAWVEHIAGEQLAKRAAVLTAIERAEQAARPSPPPEPADTGRGRRLIWAGGLVLLALAAGWVVQRFDSHGRDSVVRARRSASVQIAASPSGPRGVPPIAPAPLPLPTTPAPHQAGLVPSADEATVRQAAANGHGRARVQPVPSQNNRPPATDRARPQLAHELTNDPCIPPYSIGVNGRVLFKVECM